MIDGSEKRNRWLAFELRNSHVCEKRSKKEGKKERKLYLLRVEYINYRWPGSFHNGPPKIEIIIKIRNILLILKNPTISLDFYNSQRFFKKIIKKS